MNSFDPTESWPYLETADAIKAVGIIAFIIVVVAFIYFFSGDDFDAP